MGEYAKYRGGSIKIGTCEDMYYLRWDQRHAVTPQSGSVSPASAEDQKHIRFRFPWPEEDGLEPGAFEDYKRKYPIYGVKPSDVAEHYSVQFSAPNGYLVSLPCPESDAEQPFKVHRNGYGGAVHLVQQAVRAGVLAPVFQCGGCGAAWSVPDPKEVEPYVEALIAEARSHLDRNEKASAEYLTKIIGRILAGFGEFKREEISA